MMPQWARFAAIAALVSAAAIPAAHAPPPAVPPASPPPSTTADVPRLVPGRFWVPDIADLLLPPPGPAARRSDLDRVALAVEGAESRYGRDPRMWRPDPDGPQGPMQVSRAAALDVGGGNRFDLAENRELGRAYLLRMYARYGNWPDALAAYNWGPDNLDQWIKAGRPADQFDGGVSRYVEQVLYSAADIDASPLGGASLDDGLAAPQPAVASPRPKFPPEIRAETIIDPSLRGKIIENNSFIGQLRDFIDASAPIGPGASYADETTGWLKSADISPEQLAAADATAREALRQAGAKLIADIARAVARRPGFGDFAQAKAAHGAPELAPARLIASVLAAKLQAENATLALVDAHRQRLDANP